MLVPWRVPLEAHAAAALVAATEAALLEEGIASGDGDGQEHIPIGSMGLVLFTYMNTIINQLNVGKYTIHGWYGICFFFTQ